MPSPTPAGRRAATATDASSGTDAVSGSAPVTPGDVGAPSGLADAAASSSTRLNAPRWLGKRVGRFKLISLLGKGAYGRVFLADDTDLGRRVALKIITADATAKSVQAGASGADSGVDPADAASAARHAVGRMIREARAAARIEHPNVVQVFETGRLEGTGTGGYIAMELLDGGTLQDLVNATGPMDVARACTLVADAAEALQHAHEAGVIHRDVKPANLMLSRHGRCKVADFGLAYIDDPSDPFKYARAAGTALYMAPEVVLGHAADAKSDQYSLAATLFTLLAGRPPYVGDRKRVLTAQVDAPLPDLSPVRPELDHRLGETIRRAMSKDPGGRFADIRQFGKTLRLFTVALDAPSAGGLAGSLAGGASGSFQAAGRESASGSADLTALVAAMASSSASTAGGRTSTALMADAAARPARPPWQWLAAGAGLLAGLALLVGVGVWLGGGRETARQSAGRAAAAYAPERSSLPAPDLVPSPVADPAPPAAEGGVAVDNPEPPPAAAVDPWPRPAPEPVPAPETPPPAAREVAPPPAQPEAAPAEAPPAAAALSPLDYDRLLRIAQGKDKSYPGRRVTLTGRVNYARVSRSGKIARLFFDGSDQGHALAVVWFPADKLFERMGDRFGGEAGSDLYGKTIAVEGQLSVFGGEPQLIVTSPDQITVQK